MRAVWGEIPTNLVSENMNDGIHMLIRFEVKEIKIVRNLIWGKLKLDLE